MTVNPYADLFGVRSGYDFISLLPMQTSRHHQRDGLTPDRSDRPDAPIDSDLLRLILAFSREHNYTGWDYADGMSSAVLQALPIDNKWVNIAFQETIKRAPINIRPLFLVEQRRNFKGTALFSMANLTAYRLTGEHKFRDEAESLVDWLVSNQSTQVPEFCGSHHHDLQGLSGKTKAGTPGVVGTAYGVQALLSAADELDDRYRDVAHTSADFVINRLDYHEIDAGARILYKTTESGEYYTLNANALGARILIDLYNDGAKTELLDRATKILDYVVSQQTSLGGWMYRDPPSASHLSMDNHHNGFIVESLLRYQSVVGSSRYDDAIAESLSFYRETLFEENGAPNWDEHSSYPRDIHAAAQGILVFTYAGELSFARRIINWTLDHLYGGTGRFYFRKNRFFTKRITLMRWCQAWMAYAISEYLSAAAAHS